MVDLFRLEVDGQIQMLSDGLLLLEQDVNASAQQWEELMRAAHSIKGAARMVEFGAVVRLSHALEDCFVAAQNSRIALQKENVNLLLTITDDIKKIVAEEETAILAWEAAHEDKIASQEAAIQSLIDSAASSPEAQHVEQKTEVETAPKETTSELPVRTRGAERALRVSPKRLNRIVGLAGETVVEGRRFSYQVHTLSQIKQQQQSLALELGRLNRKLADSDVSPALLGQYQQAFRLAEDLRESLAEQFTDMQTFERRANSLSDQLHYEVMASRMRPFSDLTQALPRLVRDLGRNLNKEVRINMSGLSTLVDRDVLERIDTPLKHLVQNAVDHGIEIPEVRETKNKSREGELRLQVSQSAGMLFIVLSDDGAGIDLDNLRQRIIRKQLATAAELEPLDEMELLDFLFVPGFSTRSDVTQYSGRGVGLDIVKDAVQKLQGSIHAYSTLGGGTRFQMLLPVSVSVIRVLHTQICGDSYAIPLGRIHRLLSIAKEDVDWENGSAKVLVDGHQASLVHANTLFGGEFPQQLADELSVVVIGQQPPYQAIVVERNLGEQEVAQQRLDHIFGDVDGISAAAQLDDGSLSLIVDCDDLARSIEKLRRDARSGVDDLVQRARARKPKVLIAEDSLQTRESQKSILLQRGYEVDVVSDGQAAWDALSNESYDLLVSDIDMPGMDGLALLEHLRGHEGSRETAVLLLSRLELGQVEERIAGDRRTVYLNKADFDEQRFIHEIGSLLGWTAI
jgi:two-component system sensor histidine kinase and response regulator WspE